MDILDFIRQRAADYDCPVCRRSLRGCGLSVLRREGPTFTIKITCHACDVSFVVVIQIRDDMVALLPATQPPAPPPPPPPGRTPITLDELLDVHEALRDMPGGLTGLVRAPAPAPAPRDEQRQTARVQGDREAQD